tara:strand:- start:39 stop:1046 length:1008 start_codon:yes stop_codon:yes gene_type:complete
VGKTVSLTPTENLWRALPDHHTAPTSLTKAALIDALFDAKRRIVRPGLTPPYIEFNTLLVLAGELGVLLPMYDSDFMNALTAIYDGHPYAERRRTKDLKLAIDAPQINLLGATTPSYLNGFMPEGAWDQGFISRTLLIYSGEKVIRPLFMETTRDEDMFKALSSDLKWIGNLFGKISFSEDAAHAISAWHQAGGAPTPEHPKLAHYITRRTAHLLKLCMVACVVHSDSLTISLEDYQVALDWLTEAELYMPDIFRSMNSGGDSKAMEEAWYFIWQTYAKEKKAVAEHRVFNFLKEKVPSHSVEKVIQVMTRSGMLKQDVSGGVVAYVPAAKAPGR